MTSRRGFTLVEVMITTALVAVVVGVLASLYFTTFNRMTRGVAEVSAILQAQMLLDRMEVHLAQACDAQLVTFGGVTALKITMPSTGKDKDGDGVLDSCTPTGVSTRGIAKFNRGKRVWYYMSNATGNFGTPGNLIYQAARNDDANPTGADVVTAFSNSGGQYRYPLLDSIGFSLDSPVESVTVTVRTSRLYRNESAAGAAAAENRDNYVVTLSRKVCWRNWWK
ncbi:MAG: prepilin-type N-terminal cleavage/methylation domain-containing protein [Fimbriimonadaceae bacterium]|nr:prepilin-type N-terminal cleavage/methylation domain-containing protein [Chthonomonadaceae bacterium]MCO5296532.1 prepilin-type N-terminal cleavage/methylation domain-containing protein [Fimbriimonadaceae bacterium]